MPPCEPSSLLKGFLASGLGQRSGLTMNGQVMTSGSNGHEAAFTRPHHPELEQLVATMPNATIDSLRSQSRMSISHAKGLLNMPGQNNCFLNSAVQVSIHSLRSLHKDSFCVLVNLATCCTLSTHCFTFAQLSGSTLFVPSCKQSTLGYFLA